MKYCDGSYVLLGDKVTLPVPTGCSLARVVMLGDTREHLQIDPQFLAWVGSSDVLRSSTIVVEWLEPNPFAHENPEFAQVGNYMFTDVDEFVDLQSRAEA